LKEACDESSLIPDPGKGRQQMIADRLGVGAEAVSKWFKGVAMPRPDKMAMLADLLETDQSWLTFGIQPELDRSERRLHARESDGAVHYVWGLLALAGGHCGEPSQRDPRAAYVDFYATLRGSVYPLSVRLATDNGRDQFNVTVPVEYRSTRVIVVIPVGPGRYDCIDLPIEIIDEYKERKGGEYRLTFSNGQGGRYFFGSQQIQRIKNFGELK
jgi:transcriptional regulator with XRE-family HTH domain